MIFLNAFDRCTSEDAIRIRSELAYSAWGTEFAQCFVGDVVISAITLAELEYGVSGSSAPAQNRLALDGFLEEIPVVLFDGSAARVLPPTEN